jgi:hypothetical protein
MKIGDRVKVRLNSGGQMEAIIAEVPGTLDEVFLLCLESYSGEAWCKSVKVQDRRKITRREFMDIVGHTYFTGVRNLDGSRLVFEEDREIELADGYTAIIKDKETVKVGCQDFPVAKLREVLKAVDELED